MTVILELRQPLWMKTPKGEGLAILLTDYGPESDHLWTCIQQEGEHQGELWTWHNSEVRVLPNASMLRRGTPDLSDADKAELRKPPPMRLTDPLAPTFTHEFTAPEATSSRTIGDVIGEVKAESEWARGDNQPAMIKVDAKWYGKSIPRGYRLWESFTHPMKLFLRLDLPDDYPTNHPDEIPK